jgi:ABC-type uncharacterized transport system involved in gliding motility auxiliary subunit
MAGKSMANKTQAVIYVLIILGFVAVANYLATKKFFRVDMTEEKQYSIADPTKRMLGGLDDIINIKVYFSRDLPANAKPIEASVRDLLAEFKAYSKGNLRVSWEDPSADEDTKRRVRGLGIPEVQLQSFERDKAQAVNVFMGIAVLYADKSEVLPLVQNLNNLEYDLAQAIMKVNRSETPKIGVLKTDTMPYLPPNIQQRMQVTDKTEEKYKPIFDNLKQNYDVVTVDISEGKSIDSDIKTLIIPGGDDKSFTERDLAGRCRGGGFPVWPQRPQAAAAHSGADGALRRAGGSRHGAECFLRPGADSPAGRDVPHECGGELPLLCAYRGRGIQFGQPRGLRAG